MSEGFRFEVESRCRVSAARRGRLTTTHGVTETPAFMPVGTLGSVKGLMPEQVSGAGFGLILANTYHLALRPGVEVVSKHGGLHRFMGWDGSILTDSGGFQVYSLAKLRKVTDDGVTFRSHVDGSLHEFTPESVVAIQESLGSDVAMALDVCPPSDAPPDELRRAVDITTAWAERTIEARTRSDTAVFGIVQGGLDEELRAEHAAAISSMPFEGLAIGGLSVGEPPSVMYPMAAHTASRLPVDRPRYLMGVGMPLDLVRCSMAGIDMFDCVFPTRAGRNGLLLTSGGRLVMKNSRHRDDTGPPDPSCECPVCTRYSRAYLRHLFNSGEILGCVLGTIHNLHFYSRLMDRVRASIADGSIEELALEMEAAFPAQVNS